MNKWFSYGAIFFVTYLVFLLVKLPASLLMANVSLPKNITLQGVSGTLWHARIAQLSIAHGDGQRQNIKQVQASLSPWSLLLADPSIELNFGDALVPGPEGSLSVSGLFSVPRIDDGDILVPANLVMGQLAEQLSLPIDITAYGDIAIKLDQLIMDNTQCQVAEGQISWHQAKASAMDQTVILGPLAADVSCDQGALVLTVNPKNNLGLSFSAHIRQNGQMSGNGYLAPGDKFPDPLKNLLPFLGNTDQQGRYRLRF